MSQVACWNPSLPADAQQGLSWWFATTFVERIAANMRRLRLGGTDPILVADKAWQESWELCEKSHDFSRVPISAVIDKGLQLVFRYHAYGPALAQLLEWRRTRPIEQDEEVIVHIV